MLSDPVAYLPPHYRGDYYAADSITVRVPQWWSLQYGVDKWRERGITGAGVVVVVCDTGVDASHPDLAGQVAAEVDGTGEGNGDRNAHGTHCSGIIAAKWDGAGVAGIAAGVKIVAAKGLTANGSGSSATLARALTLGIRAARQLNPISIITSNSWGGPGRIPQVEAVFAANPDVINVAAAGNDGRNNGVDHPAAGAYAMGIGAHDEQRTLASFSDRGSQVDLVAPGVQVLSTVPGGGWQKFSGTSMATPCFAAFLALRQEAEFKKWGEVRTKKISQVTALLRQCCDDGGPPGRDDGYGWGFVNLDRWLEPGDPPPPQTGQRWTVESSTFKLDVVSPDQPTVKAHS